MDIYTYLKKDHRLINDLIEQVLNSKSPTGREEIFDEIKQEFLVHAETEQATFYSAIKDEDDTRENIEDATDEHEDIKDILRQLSKMSANNEKWLVLFGELKQAIEHHVQDEETRIFDKAKEILSEHDANQLALDMDRMKDEFLDRHAA